MMNVGFHGDVQGHSAQDKEIRFLLVSGASGGGKSTFIRALTQGWLDPYIVAQLPSGCANWPVIDVNDIHKEGLAISKVLESIGPEKCAVLHYDISYIFRWGLPSYADDAADALFKLASRIDCVFVKTDGARLRRQHLARERERMRRKSRAEIAWRKCVRKPMRVFAQSLRGIRRRRAQHLYAQPEFLVQCYSLWESYARALGVSCPDYSLLTVEPEKTLDGPPMFRLVPTTR